MRDSLEASLSEPRRRSTALLLLPAAITALLGVVAVGIYAASAARAFVGGESQWSKSQKRGIAALNRYALTRDDADYQRYLASRGVPNADRVARLEIQKPDGSSAKAEQAFIDGANHPDDVARMVRLMRWGGAISHVSRALDIWTAGDSLRDRVAAVADTLHTLIGVGPPSAVRERQMLDEIQRLDEELTHLESRFSATLGEGARWADRVVLTSSVIAGVLLMWVGTVIMRRLIRQQQRASELERQRSQELRALVAYAPDAIARFGPTLRWLYANAVAERWLTRAGTPVEGRSLLETGWNPQAAATIEAALRQVFTTGEDFQVSTDVSVDGGVPRRYDVRMAAERTAGGEVGSVLAIARDTTELVASQKALREREEHLRQAQKMEAVGQLAGGVAHDFNNLLTIIRGNVELAEQALTGNTLPVEELVEVRRASDRAAALVRQLLAFSRRQPVQLQLTDVNDVLRDLHEMLTRLIGETIALETTLAPGLPTVMLDAGALQQVIMNLVVNARDAMPGGGGIRISTAIDAESPARPVRITVKDSGHGMSEDVRARAFEPFFTTKEVGKGTGLGLAVVYGIVTHADGDISIESIEGIGTSIHIHLPVSRAPRERMATPVTQPRLPGNESLLVVEDEPAVRQFTVNVLQQLGYRVVAVADGVEALRHLDEGHGVDAIVTDVVMPQMGGPTLIRTLAENGHVYPVVFMSGYTSDGVALEDLMTDRSCFLSKPFGPSDLGAAVRRVLDPVETTAG